MHELRRRTPSWRSQVECNASGRTARARPWTRTRCGRPTQRSQTPRPALLLSSQRSHAAPDPAHVVHAALERKVVCDREEAEVLKEVAVQPLGAQVQPQRAKLHRLARVAVHGGAQQGVVLAAKVQQAVDRQKRDLAARRARGGRRL